MNADPTHFHSEWALLLGGSSGFGLATARKLASHGMHLAIVHRDRRSAMRRIEPEFERLRSKGIELRSWNLDALADDARARVVEELDDALAGTGRLRLLLHSIAFGNLKPLAPPAPAAPRSPSRELATALGVDPQHLEQVVAKLLEEGLDAIVSLAPPAATRSSSRLGREDFARTIYSMGTSLVDWVQDLHDAGLFAPDARVVGLTSEGNRIAWPSYAAVSAAKVALEAAARSIATEFGPHGIRCNVVQAGVTDTPALRLIPGANVLKARARLRNPFGRLTRPEDVANAIYLLCTDEASWINGAVLRVDGGEQISGAGG